eukprot:gene5569-6257_t
MAEASSTCKIEDFSSSESRGDRRLNIFYREKFLHFTTRMVETTLDHQVLSEEATNRRCFMKRLKNVTTGQCNYFQHKDRDDSYVLY